MRCNFRCIFCHRENSQESLRGELNHEELGILVEALAKVGIRKYKITGGEPLMRDDIIEVVKSVRNYGLAEDISMTTNGYFLEELAGRLVDGGLNRVNVSLHSLKPERFEFITGVNAVAKVISGIKEATNYDLKIKINFVALKGINEAEVWDVVNFAEGLGVHVQLIELHPVGKGKNVFTDYHALLRDVLNRLSEKASKVIIRGELHNRPIYVLPSGITVEVVRPVLNPIFCAGCSRIRVAPDGSLMPCLSSDLKLPTIDLIRGKGSRDEKVSGVLDLISKVNDLRRPHVMWPLRGEVDLEYLNIVKLGGFTRKFRLTQ